MSPTSGPAGDAAWALWQDSPWGRLRYHVVARLLRSWTDDLGEGLRVLDAGGGDGRDALPFALAGHDVTVLDRSPEMLALARAAAAAAGVGDRLHTVAADLEDLTALAALTRHREGGSGSFDVVFCHDVLQHRASHAQVRADVATLVSSVRPGGLVSLLAPNPPADVVATVLGQGPRPRGWRWTRNGRATPPPGTRRCGCRRSSSRTPSRTPAATSSAAPGSWR